jgi:site-specific DNA recombinase
MTRRSTEIRRLANELGQEQSSLSRELANIERKIGNIRKAILDGFYDPEMKSLRDQLEGQKKVQEKLILAGAPRTIRLHPNIAELYRTKVADPEAALNIPAAKDEAREIIRSLVEKIVAKPDLNRRPSAYEPEVTALGPLCPLRG